MERYGVSFDILVDSDAFVGFFLPDDAHFTAASNLFNQCFKQNIPLTTTNYIVAETATVLSRRSSQQEARRFLAFIHSGSIPLIYVDYHLHLESVEIFIQQENKNTSLFDCSNVAVMRHFAIPQIFSFDKVYEKKFDLKVLA
jgi:predicted nucleic acid-binding protein